MDQDKLWAYYQTEAVESFKESVPRLNFLVNQLSPHSRVLNIGVGSGAFEERALQKGHDVYTLDPIEPAINRLRERLNLGDKAQVGYGQNMPFEDTFFDAVVISEVFEHLTPEVMDTTLAEINRVLRREGKLLGTVPAREDFKANLVICPHCGELFHRWGHLQTFTMEQMRSNLEKYFMVEKIIERPFMAWSQYRLSTKALAAVKMMFWYAGVHSSNERMFFNACKV